MLLLRHYYDMQMQTHLHLACARPLLEHFLVAWTRAQVVAAQ